MDLTQFTVQPLTPIVGSVKDLNATWLRDYIYCNHHNPASGFTTYQYLIDTCTEDVYNYRTIPAAVEVTTELYQQL